MIYAAADLHGNLIWDVPSDASALLLAGDICPDFGGSVDHRQRNWLDTEFRNWLEWLTLDHDVEVVATWGNHDYVGQKPFLVPDLPWTVLVDSEHTLKTGERVWGTPWVPNLPRWAFYGDKRRLQMRAELIPDGLDVLMTHGPPFLHGDFIPSSPRQVEKYGNYHGEHVGDPTLNLAIRRAHPRVTICGHIHEARGSYIMPNDSSQGPWHKIENVAAVDIMYDLVPDPWVKL
jgi:Icc-related predicted phosphoesterase